MVVPSSFNHANPGNCWPALITCPVVVVLQVGESLAIELHGHLGKWRMSRVRICPTQIQNGVGEFSALFLVQVANAQENLGDDVLVEPGLSRRWNRGIFPGDPARRVGHAAVFFGKARAGQAIDRGVDLLLFFGCNSRRSPEFAGLIRINFAHHQPVGLLQCIDVLVRVRTDHYAVHSEGQHALDLAVVHVVPDVGP